MPAQTLIPVEEADSPAQALPPPGPVVLLEAAELPEESPTPGERLAYLFRRCQAHPLRQILADHRGVHE